MVIKTLKLKRSLIYSFIAIISIFMIGYYLISPYVIASISPGIIWEDSNINNSNESRQERKYIKWVEFNATYDVLDKTAKLDISSHAKQEKVTYQWIELLSYLACKYGGDFNRFKQKDLDSLCEKLKAGNTMEELTKNMKYYSYYYEAYTAILSEFIGEYEIETLDPDTNEIHYTKKYGIKAFLPIAKNYSFSHYKDFGSSRTYGFARKHLGNDLMGSIGTPIIAIESGIIEAAGWNQYGGWRIGIRSFDKKRYYYYAHLRKDHPFAKGISEGSVVKAGDVIGYLGMTGYSTKENVNNINVPHLHFGMQLIFDESQKEGNNEIWIDVYSLIEFLRRNKSEIYLEDTTTKDYARKYDFMEQSLKSYLNSDDSGEIDDEN